MTSYDYKVVPAPRRARKIKGVKRPEELFAMTLTEAINEVARQGWEYVCTESLVAEGPGSWFRRGSSTEHTVMVFRRERDAIGPRLAAVGAPGTVGQGGGQGGGQGAGPQEPQRTPELAPATGRDRQADRSLDRPVLERPVLERPVLDRPVERPVDRAVERVVVDRLQSTLRHQPVRLEPRIEDDAPPRRPGPRLGPAEQP